MRLYIAHFPISWKHIGVSLIVNGRAALYDRSSIGAVKEYNHEWYLFMLAFNIERAVLQLQLIAVDRSSA